MRNLILAAAVTGILSVTACGPPSAVPAAAPAKAAAAAAPSPHASAINACYRRKPAGDIYVRTVIPGLAAQAQELGGAWNWDYVTGKCLSAVNFTIASAADGPGDCTTVGWVSGNPGYDANAAPARPIRNVAAVAGPGC